MNRNWNKTSTNIANKYCGQVLDVFAEVYASFYDKGFEQEVKKESSARSKLNYRFLIKSMKGN